MVEYSNDRALAKLFKVLVIFLVHLILALVYVRWTESTGAAALFFVAVGVFLFGITSLITAVISFFWIRDSKKVRLIISFIFGLISYPLVILLSTQINNHIRSFL